MNKVILPILVLLSITGCSIRTVGDVEALNNTRLESVRKTINTADTLLNMTRNYHNSPSSGKLNRAVGHAKQVRYTDIPSTTQQINDLQRYTD